MSANAQPVEIGVGATETLSLRLSAATLIRVLFEHPETGQLMLALERTATLRDDARAIEVKARPIGGGIRILDPPAVYQRLGGFHFDSRRSRREADFRIFIRPEDREKAIEFCREHFFQDDGAVLECSPVRELVEEFEDSLKKQVTVDRFRMKWLRTVVEPVPKASSSPRAPGSQTIHIYNIFLAEILDPELVEAVLENSQRYTDEDLRTLAGSDSGGGWRGRANALLALPYELLVNAYLEIPPEERGRDHYLHGHWLAGNVWTVL